MIDAITGGSDGEPAMERRVYDCVLFNGEFEVLAIRIRELKDVVYKFVVVESNKTFSGTNKPVLFTKHHPAIRDFSSQLDFVLVDDMPQTDTAWDREAWQRNCVVRGLSGASDHDLILMSDVDEIPRMECVREALADKASLAFGFRMGTYYFYMNYRNIKGHPNIVWTVGAKFELLRSYKPDALRYEIRDGIVPARIFENGGWHFSYLMDEIAVRKKINDFSHQEFNQRNFLRKIDIPRIIAESGDLYGRTGYEWSIVEEPDLPRYVLEHRTDFQKYFYAGPAALDKPAGGPKLESPRSAVSKSIGLFLKAISRAFKR